MTETAAVPVAAFELHEDYDIRTFGGSVADKEGKMFDLATALEEGEGTIQVHDEFLATTLDTHAALVRVEVEVPEDVHYSKLNREPLNEYAASVGVEDPKSYRTKDDLIEAVDAHLAESAEAANREEASKAEAEIAAEAERAAAAEAERAAAAEAEAQEG